MIAVLSALFSVELTCFSLSKQTKLVRERVWENDWLKRWLGRLHVSIEIEIAVWANKWFASQIIRQIYPSDATKNQVVSVSLNLNGEFRLVVLAGNRQSLSILLDESLRQVNGLNLALISFTEQNSLFELSGW